MKLKIKLIPIRIFLGFKKFANKFVKCRTYHIENIFVAVILITIAIITRKGLVEWIGVVAVYLNFGYIAVADRLREAEEIRKEKKEPVMVECFKKLDYYYISKEFFWLLYFVLLGAYSALAGIIIFLCYRPWRVYYRKYSKILLSKN